MARYLRNVTTGAITTVLHDDDATYISLLAQRQANLPNRPLYEQVSLDHPNVTPHSGGAAGGAAAALMHFGFAATSAPEAGGDGIAALPANGGITAGCSCALQTIRSGAGHGFSLLVNFPTLSGGTIEANMEFDVTNPDGSEKITVYGPLDVNLSVWDTTFTGWTIGSQVGSDLAISGDFATLDSTAGGEFSATWILIFTCIGLAT